MDTNEESISVLFHKLMRMHHHKIVEMFASHGLYAAHPPIMGVLRKHDGCSQNMFVEKLYLQPATISNALKRMENAGFVRREKDKIDQRVTRVYMTDKGKSILSEVDKASNDIKNQWFKGFTTEEKVLLRRFILHMFENLTDAKSTKKDKKIC